LIKLPLLGALTGTVTVQKLFAAIEPPVKVTDEPPRVAEAVPPHVVSALPETTMPPGNVSVSDPVMSAAVLLVFVRVMISVELPPAVIVAGLKALLNVTAEGGETINVASAAPGLFPLLVCKAPAAIELSKLPPLAAVTGTVTVQELLPGIEPPVKVTAELPIVAVTTPPQVVLAEPETSMPLGNVSTSGALKLAAAAFALLRVMVRVETPPAGMVAGLKALLSVGGIFAGTAVKVAMAGPALLPRLVCNAPASSTLMKLPATGAVTPTVIVQELFAKIDPPVKVTVEPPIVAEGVPLHVVLALPETVTPLGNVSTRGAVRLAAVAFVLVKVMVSVELPPAVMLAGPKALPSVTADGGGNSKRRDNRSYVIAVTGLQCSDGQGVDVGAPDRAGYVHCDGA
jgi:hypothetical protein